MEKSATIQRLFRPITTIAIIFSMLLSPAAASMTSASPHGIETGSDQQQQIDLLAEDEPSGRDALDEAQATVMAASSAKGATPTATTNTVSASNVGSIVQNERYIVVLEGEALATYSGDVSGLAATSARATGREKLNPRTPESLAYLSHLEQEQAAVIIRMNRTLGRDVEIPYRYQRALNGFAAPKRNRLRWQRTAAVSSD